MRNLKRVTRIAAGAILATGIFAGTIAAPADAAAGTSQQSVRMSLLDTGWGG